MCIVAEQVKVANKDIKVYKVFTRGETPFRGIQGYEVFGDGIASLTVWGVSQMKAHGFDLGYGYSAFLKRKNALTYQSILKMDCMSIEDFIIPKGTRYAIGKIGKSMPGQGLRAVRCEHLKK